MKNVVKCIGKTFCVNPPLYKQNSNRLLRGEHNDFGIPQELPENDCAQ